MPKRLQASKRTLRGITAVTTSFSVHEQCNRRSRMQLQHPHRTGSPQLPSTLRLLFLEPGLAMDLQMSRCRSLDIKHCNKSLVDRNLCNTRNFDLPTTSPHPG